MQKKELSFYEQINSKIDFYNTNEKIIKVYNNSPLIKEVIDINKEILQLLLTIIGSKNNDDYNNFYKNHLNKKNFSCFDDFLDKICFSRYFYKVDCGKVFLNDIKKHLLFIKNNNKKIKKKSIPAVVKRLVWNNWIGEEIGKSKCLCCKITDITQLSFNCGHIIAEKNGGETIVSNLKPICQNCNSSMGTKNMNDFIKSLL